jgi:hypothetical protein
LRIKEQKTRLTLQEHDEDDKGVSVYFIVMPNNFIIFRAHMTVVYALKTNLKKDRNVPGCKNIYWYEFHLLHSSGLILDQ